MNVVKTIGLSVLATALGVHAGTIALSQQGHESRSFALWRESPETPRLLADASELVVVARLIGTRPGRRVTPSTTAPRIEFQVNDFRLVSTLKVDPAVTIDLQNGTFSVERTSRITSWAGHSASFSGDGGNYETSRNYLLFLKRQPEGSLFYQVNGESRFEVASGVLKTSAVGSVASLLSGKSLAQAEQLLSDSASADPTRSTRGGGGKR